LHRLLLVNEAAIIALWPLAVLSPATMYAQIYAQRGDRRIALEWLEKALRLRDPGFRRLKTDPLMDPLRGEPRVQEIEQQLKFPG
jgi:hypothetical protein